MDGKKCNPLNKTQPSSNLRKRFLPRKVDLHRNLVIINLL